MSTVTITEGRRKLNYVLPMTSTGQRIAVQAYATATPGLIATQALINGTIHPERFFVTHEKSGFRLDTFRWGAPLDIACLFAGALGGLPIAWTGDENKVRADYGKIADVKVRAWLNAK